MTHQPERRGNPRFATYLQTFVASGREEGPAVLADVSAVGALLAQTELRPELGAPVRLSVILRSEQILHAMGKVVPYRERSVERRRCIGARVDQSSRARIVVDSRLVRVAQ